MKGSYVLFIELSSEKRIPIGKKRFFIFPSGWYVYVGSAMNGIERRVKRHLSNEKRMHWHIDYFLQYAQIKKIFYKQSSNKEECEIAQSFIRSFNKFKGFGSSDCSCESHLFHGSKAQLLELIDTAGCSEYRF